MPSSLIAVTPGTGASVLTDPRTVTITGGIVTTADAQSIVNGGVAGVPLASAVLVGLTAVPLPAVARVNRKALYVHNAGAFTIWIGGAGVTASTGIPIDPGAGQGFDAAEECVLYAIAGTAGQDVRVLELV